MSFCRNCGQPVDPDAWRCPNCGANTRRRGWLWYVLWGLAILGLVAVLLAVAAFAACLMMFGRH